MDDRDAFLTTRSPTANRPLLGLTVLVVEDSRFSCDAMRLLCLRSGARIRRADCLRSARRHLQVYRPTVVIIDLGLPDGNGVDLIQELSRAEPRVAVVLGTSGDAGGAGFVFLRPVDRPGEGAASAAASGAGPAGSSASGAGAAWTRSA